MSSTIFCFPLCLWSSSGEGRARCICVAWQPGQIRTCITRWSIPRIRSKYRHIPRRLCASARGQWRALMIRSWDCSWRWSSTTWWDGRGWRSRYQECKYVTNTWSKDRIWINQQGPGERGYDSFGRSKGGGRRNQKDRGEMMHRGTHTRGGRGEKPG